MDVVDVRARREETHTLAHCRWRRLQSAAAAAAVAACGCGLSFLQKSGRAHTHKLLSPHRNYERQQCARDEHRLLLACCAKATRKSVVPRPARRHPRASASIGRPHGAPASRQKQNKEEREKKERERECVRPSRSCTPPGRATRWLYKTKHGVDRGLPIFILILRPSRFCSASDTVYRKER